MASWAYGAAVRLRGWSLARGIQRVRRLPVPVISIGNLTIGGTGKTPLVMLIAETLRDRGWRVVILSRGYARRGGSTIQRVSDGNRVLADLHEVGDEPFMMAHRLPGVGVWVGADRFSTGMRALEEEDVDVFVLDDGFQHRMLHRDLDLVMVRGPRPLANRRLLPSGPLREPPEALKRADLAVLLSEGGPECKARSMEEIRQVASGLKVVGAIYRPTGLWDMGRKSSIPLEALLGKRVALVCAIGRPDGFEATVSGLGAKVEAVLSFPDHHWYTPKDIDRIYRLRRDLDALVTTEKDSWKLCRAIRGDDMDIWVLTVELGLEEPDILHGYLANLL